MSLFGRNFVNRLKVKSFANYAFDAKVVRLNCIHCYTQSANPSLIQVKTQKCAVLKNPVANTALDRRHFSQLNFFLFKKSVSEFFNKILFINTSKQNAAGYNWFKTLDQVNYQEFFTLLNLEDSYFSWYKVTELHVWMLLTRLMQCGGSFRNVRNSLIQAMWIDVQKRARIIEPLNKNFKKNIGDIYERFRVSLVLYDEGFLTDDRALANALWHHFFEEECEDPRLIEALISFIRYQIDLLLLVSVEDEGFVDIKKQIWTSFKPHVESVK